MKTKLSILSVFIMVALLLGACSSIPAVPMSGQTAPAASGGTANSAPTSQPTAIPNVAPTSIPQASAPDPAPAASGEALAALQGTFENIYTQVNPSVVNIQVTSKVAQSDQSQFSFELPFSFNNNDNNQQPSLPRTQHALGSGFVWDNSGYIVTNNHVVDGADKVMVTFSDGQILPAKVVGTDPDADLAVIKVENASNLRPLTLSDSDKVKVGQLAVAIGNPFGLEGTMTVGIVSALGRSLSVDSKVTSSATYTIPDVIQTDAPINPGNSGGVLLNANGQVIGVTSAIESTVNSNAGIGFVIPSNIVQRVVPELIKNGRFEHAWLGISGTTLTPQVAKEMNLPENQRGILVIDLTSGSPADKAGIRGSDRQAKIDDTEVSVGGDVIVAVNGQKLEQFDDLVSFLFKEGAPGKTIKLDVLRNGKPESLDVTLAARPASANSNQVKNNETISGKAWLGIQGTNLTADINKAMNLKDNQEGALVVKVIQGSPADKAGLSGSAKTAVINGQQVQVGGDVITSVDGKPVKSMADLKDMVNNSQPGSLLTFGVLRDGKEMNIEVTLEAAPAN